MKNNNSYDWKQSRNSFTRKFGSKGSTKKIILIVCEGEKTEPNYFKSFRVSSVKINVIGLGANTISLVNETKKLVNEYRRKKIKFDSVWCVFDLDNFPVNNFNNAITLARSLGYKVAYSNESFELWYILHFNYYDSALSRQQYNSLLDSLLGKKYKKNDPNMYESLISKQSDAIRNAKRLLSIHSGKTPGMSNPSTMIYELVELLNENI